MEKIEQFDIRIDTSLLATFQNMPMEMYKVFREFIDNSLQSYLDHREQLDSLPGSPKKCIVNITWDKSEIVVVDNSWGMDKSAFARAMKLNSKAPEADNDDRLSRFGMGLKTAACYASRDYIIESAAFGNGQKFRTEMDIDYIQRYAPETNSTTISECSPDEHGTTIRLKKLNPSCRPTTKTEGAVRKTLARIYYMYLQDDLLDISINNERIVSEDPPLQIDPEKGTEVICSVDNSAEEGFLFQGKKYRYMGWIGVLKTGDSSGSLTGFNYYQAKRCVVFSDHPETLFGKSNDARFQHVVGQIELLGNEWPITTNKDQINWGDQGLKDCLIADLLKEKSVKEVFDFAKNFKFRTQTMSKRSKKGSNASSETSAPANAAKDGETTEAALAEATPVVPATAKTVTATVSNHISYKGTRYAVNFKVSEGDPDADWIKLSQGPDENKNEIGIEINNSSPYLSNLVTNQQSQKLLYALAQAFALARIEAVKGGLPLNESFTLEEALNDIMRKAE